MSKTVFSAGDQSQGIKGTKVTAAFLNALQNHRHDGADADGSCPINYAATGGTANALTLALVPAITAHVIGMPIVFKATSANTSAVTITINGLAVKAIKDTSGNALVAGALAAGSIAMIVYDGADYRLISANAALPLATLWAANGYQKLAGGLIVQWGYGLATAAGNAIVFPVTFPSACVAVTIGQTAITSETGIGSVGVTGFVGWAGGNVNIYWIAIGW